VEALEVTVRQIPAVPVVQAATETVAVRHPPVRVIEVAAAAVVEAVAHLIPVQAEVPDLQEVVQVVADGHQEVVHLLHQVVDKMYPPFNNRNN